MSERNDRNIKKKTILIPAGLLFLLVCVSSAFLFGRLPAVFDQTPGTAVDLRSGTSVFPDSSSEQTQIGSDASSEQAPPTSSSSFTPGVEVSDDRQIWTSDTKVDIFRISYENGERKVTAVGKNGDKIIAPGTTGSYQFKIANTGNVAMKYTMTAEAYVNRRDTVIPVVVRLSDQDGTFFAGGADAWAPVLDLNHVKTSAVLAKNHYANYSLTWQWPFEGDDAADTFLGDLAAAEDITLTVVIHTTAEANEDPNGGGGIPNTGDVSNLLLWGAVAAVSFVCLLLLVFCHRGNREDSGHGKKG